MNFEFKKKKKSLKKNEHLQANWPKNKEKKELNFLILYVQHFYILLVFKFCSYYRTSLLTATPKSHNCSLSNFLLVVLFLYIMIKVVSTSEMFI